MIANTFIGKKANRYIAEWSSQVARLAHAQKVAGSNPASAIEVLAPSSNGQDAISRCYKSGFGIHIIYVRTRSYTNKQLEEAIRESSTWSDVRRKLNITPSAKTHASIKKNAKRLGLSLSHIKRGYYPPASKKSLEEYLVLGSECQGGKLRKRLIEEGVKSDRCEKCGLSEWLGEKLPLQLDHINGDRKDNRLENLRLLCGNCHSLTDTFGVKNRKFTKKYYFCDCGKEITKNAKQCVNCSNKNKKRPTTIEWPPPKEVFEMVEETNFSKTGKKLGVSDNAVRKFLRRHGLLE